MVFEPIPPSASGFSCKMTGTGSKHFLELRGSLLMIGIRHDLPSVATDRVQQWHCGSRRSELNNDRVDHSAIIGHDGHEFDDSRGAFGQSNVAWGTSRISSHTPRNSIGSRHRQQFQLWLGRLLALRFCWASRWYSGRSRESPPS